MAILKDLFVSFRSGQKSQAQPRVALLEDSPEEAQAVTEMLRTHGMSVARRGRADLFLDMLRRDSFDVLVLDWNLPDLTGYEVLRRIRDDLRLGVPVLMLTARDGEFEVVQALNGGADDYLTKPWRPFELLARLNVLLRGAHPTGASRHHEEIDGWVFNGAQRQVSRGGEPIKLPAKEFEVALLLFRHLGKALSRDHINQAVWGGEMQSRTVDTHVSRVRTKLDLTVANGYQLQAIYGFGYRLNRIEPDLP